jgi:hypothetical protein
MESLKYGFDYEIELAFQDCVADRLDSQARKRRESSRDLEES